MRLWFAQKTNQDKKICWDNYQNNFQEANFLKNLETDLITKSHKLSFEYRLKNANLDYSQNYSDSNLILLIHGDNDDKVPIESLNIVFSNRIIVEQGDHDLERPGIVEQWLTKASEFLFKHDL